MIGKTHRSFAFASATGALLVANQFTTLFEGKEPTQALIQAGAITAVAVVTSTLPDFDRLIPFIRHRGITHSIWVIMIISYLTWKFKTDVKYFIPMLGLLIGYTSHIVGDAFSKAGIAWFYPFQRYESYSSGAFHVKGFRGIFQPLYSVGTKTFIPPTLIWYGIGLACSISLVMQLLVNVI